MKRILMIFMAALLGTYVSSVLAQQPKLTNIGTVKITTGLTFQLLYPINQSRQSLTIENNNISGTDTCYILIGGPWQAGDTTSTTRNVIGGDGVSRSLTGAQAALTLAVNGSYTRYYPLVPSDQILATCTTTADSLYADSQ